jgi:hypothetical protein
MRYRQRMYTKSNEYRSDFRFLREEYPAVSQRIAQRKEQES